MRIGLIAGSGNFPILFAKTAKEKGFEVYTAAYNNETDKNIENFVYDIKWFYLGQIKSLIKYFKKNNIKSAVMLGAIAKQNKIFTDIKPDIKAITMLSKLLTMHDDNILRAFAKTLENEGINIESSTFLLPELIAKEGCWTKRKPTYIEKMDIELGFNIAKEIGRLDIGQCIVINAGTILAVEAIEGTDETIKRGGILGNGKAVVVKICKPEQDMRFDIPAIGAGTILTMQAAGAKTLVIEAEKAVVFDKEEMIDKANKADISIIAIKR
jgi:UDP-2,3-diacylglucosamine hydrolase